MKKINIYKYFTGDLNDLFQNKTLDKRFVNNLYRMLSSLKFYSSFILNFPDRNLINDVLLKIAAYSNYLTDILVRNPEYIEYLLCYSFWDKKLDKDFYQQTVNNTLAAYNDYEKKIRALIRIKRREMFCIGVYDITGMIDTLEVLSRFSSLTDILISEAFNIAKEQTKTTNLLKNINLDYCMIALGKLGGSELNYSSDVDLMFFYDEKSFNNIVYAEEFYETTISRFIKFCTFNYPEGYLYRIDFRLRPYGKNSTLAKTLHSTISYYELNGKDWERQMLIKSRFLCGNETLFNKFKKEINGFIYSYSGFLEPKDLIIKYQLSYELLRKDENNIKFSEGGIRDIEFLIQILQLIWSIKYPALKNSNTIQSLKVLLQFNLISKKEYTTIYAAYIFFRKIENFVQLLDDKQVHSLPSDEFYLDNLASYSLCNNRDKFLRSYSKWKEKVNSIYNDFFKTKNNIYKITENEFDNNELKRIINLFEINRYSKYDDSGIDINIILELLIKRLEDTPNPKVTLSNFYKVAQAYDFSSFFLKQLKEPIFLDSIFLICGSSNYLFILLLNSAMIREFLLLGKLFYSPTQQFSFLKYNNSELTLLKFYLSLNYLLGLIDINYFSENLRRFFDKAVNLYLQKIIEEDGLSDLAIIALGSYARNELILKSDIDLLYITDPVIKSNFHKNIEIHLRTLNNEFPENNLDVRLRPEGKSSKLNWTQKEIQDYFQKRAKFWEFIAYSNHHVIHNGKKIKINFEKLFKSTTTFLDQKHIIKEYLNNLQKLKSSKIKPSVNSIDIKYSNGGITDTQFIFSLAKIFKLLFNKNIMNNIEKQNLKKNLIILRELNLCIQILFNKSNCVLTSNNKENESLKIFFKIDRNKNIIDYFKEILLENYTIQSKIIKRLL